MAEIYGGEKSRNRLIRAFSGIVQPKSGKNVAGGISDFFQSGALAPKDIAKILGTEDEFLERYSAFEKSYFKSLDTQVGKIKGNKLTVELMKKRGIIDLTLLDYETANALSDKFKQEVMRVDQLFQHAGLPSIEMPSANLYRRAFKFEIDNSAGIQHPAQILLNSMMFNFNPDRRGLESLSLGRSNILGSKNLSNIWKQFKSALPPGFDPRDISTLPPGFDLKGVFKKQINPFGGMREGQKILMFDTETTGVDKASQVRSFSVRQMTVQADGSLSYDVGDSSLAKFDVGFNSKKLAGFNVANLNGGTQTLNEFIASMEQTRNVDMGPGGRKFLDEATKFLDMLSSADKVAGQNLGFDLRVLTDTITAQSEFSNHKEVQVALNKFYNKIDDGDFAVDTLISTRMYLQNEVQQIIDAGGDQDVIKRSQKFVDTLMANDTLAKVHLGGSSAYASVENIALNTNLFELIEKEGQAEKLFDVIKRGSHIAETDVHLQSFITKYVQSGQLKIRQKVLKGAGDSEFGQFARRIVSKSSAITPTTNIADVQHLHRTAFDYLTDLTNVDEKGLAIGVKDVRLSLLGSEIAGLTTAEKAKFGGEEGFLSFGKNGEYIFTSSEGTHRLSNQLKAQQTIIDTIREAAAAPTQDRIEINGIKHNVLRNRASEKIVDLGITYEQGSRIAELAERGRLNVGTSVDINDISEAMGSMYRKLGTGISSRDQMAFLAGRGMTGGVFSSGIAEFDIKTAKDIAQAFAKIGDPYAEILDTQSRVFSSILSQATASIATEAGNAARAAGVASEAIAHTAHASLTSGLGISYFKSQDVTRIFDLATDTKMATSKPLITQALFKQAMEQAGLSDKKVRLTLSKAGGGRDFRINAAVDIKNIMNEDEAKSLSQAIIDIMSDDEKMKKAHKGVLSPKTSDDMARLMAMSPEERIAATENLADYMQERGLGILQVGGKEARAIDRDLTAAGYILDNDARNSASVRLLQSELTDDYAAVGPVTDTGAVIKSGNQTLLDAAETSVEIGDGKKIDRVLKIAGDHARSIESTDGAATKLATQLSRDKYGLPENQILDFYLGHQKGIRNVAIGLAVAGTGYYLNKKHRDNAIFEETLAQQPTTPGTTIDSMQANNRQVSRMEPSPNDYLSTAGIVGNLDRSKIGHTRMGNNKYDHLYGG